MKNTFLLCAILSLLFSSCEEECGVVAEPTLFINFTKAKPIFTKIEALGILREIPVAGVTPSVKRGYGDLILPLNLNANSTTYILTQDNRTDTLTVFYQKKLNNPSWSCGTVLDLEAPTQGRQVVSSFKSVNIQYLGYYGITESFTYRSGGGINIFISLP